jgi:hypothetical protein
VSFGLKEFYFYVIQTCSDASPICGKLRDEDDAQPLGRLFVLTDQQDASQSIERQKKLYVDRCCARTLVLAQHHVKEIRS